MRKSFIFLLIFCLIADSLRRAGEDRPCVSSPDHLPCFCSNALASVARLFTQPRIGKFDGRDRIPYVFNRNSTGGPIAPNLLYYLELGQGIWKGVFHFWITDWTQFAKAKLGFLNRSLALASHFVETWFGPPSITVRMRGFRGQGDTRIATNNIRVKKFGLTIFRQDIEYRLNRDGRKVTVVGWERHGFLPWHPIKHWGMIAKDGYYAKYRIPMLGGQWRATSIISPDGRRLQSIMTSPWAISGETILKTGA